MLINLASQYAPWLPGRLFANGQQGVWYVPQPVYRGDQVLYQDDAGTTPVTADDDPVGNAQDLSPNDNDATQSVSADRPTYNTDGALHWLAGDGSSDFMAADIPALDLANNPFILSVSGRWNELFFFGPFILSLSNGSDTEDWFGFRATDTQFIMRMTDSGGSARDITGSASDTNAHVFTLTGDGQGTVTFYIDGTLQGSSSPAGLTISKLGLLALVRSAGEIEANADVNGLIFAMDAEQHRDQVESYLANLAGITL